MAVMLFITLLSAGAQKNIPASDIKVAMMKATRFMVEKVSNRGGYLWNYSPDFSRCWGELEAKPSMIWIEAGTPAMGNVFLNAYQLTGESYYLKAAQAAQMLLSGDSIQVGDGLICWTFPEKLRLSNGIPKYRKDIFIVLRNILIIMEIVLMMMRLPTIVECSFCVCIY